MLRRPYWLLLVLALFLGGQTAAQDHWHHGGKTVDYDCALCVLSSVTSGAITSDDWVPLVISAFSAIFIYLVVVPARAAVRFHDSRAPPHFS